MGYLGLHHYSSWLGCDWTNQCLSYINVSLHAGKRPRCDSQLEGLSCTSEMTRVWVCVCVRETKACISPLPDSRCLCYHEGEKKVFFGASGLKNQAFLGVSKLYFEHYIISMLVKLYFKEFLIIQYASCI